MSDIISKPVFQSADRIVVILRATPTSVKRWDSAVSESNSFPPDQCIFDCLPRLQILASQICSISGNRSTVSSVIASGMTGSAQNAILYGRFRLPGQKSKILSATSPRSIPIDFSARWTTKIAEIFLPTLPAGILVSEAFRAKRKIERICSARCP